MRVCVVTLGSLSDAFVCFAVPLRRHDAFGETYQGSGERSRRVFLGLTSFSATQYRITERTQLIDVWAEDFLDRFSNVFGKSFELRMMFESSGLFELGNRYQCRDPFALKLCYLRRGQLALGQNGGESFDARPQFVQCRAQLDPLDRT